MLTSPTRPLRLTAGARNWRQIVASCERKLQIVAEMNDVVSPKIEVFRIADQISNFNEILDAEMILLINVLDSSNK